MGLHQMVVFAVVAGSCLFSSASHAQNPAVQNPEGAKAFVADLSSQAIEVMTGKDIPDAERTQRFRQLFVGAVDLPLVGRLVLARAWRTASPDQRSRFMKAFEDVVVLTWANRFKNTRGTVRVQIGEAKPDRDKEMQVDQVIIRENHQPIPVIWRLRSEGNSWRAIDLVVEGTSMIATYREEYTAVIAQNGGSVDALVDALQRKAAQLSQP